MIVEMKKLKLAALSYERESIISALSETGVVQLTECKEPAIMPLPSEGATYAEALSSAENALNILVREAEDYAKQTKSKTQIPSDGFEVSYEDYIKARFCGEEVERVIQEVNRLSEEKNSLKAGLAKARRALTVATPYFSVKEEFSQFQNTEHATVFFGMLTQGAYNEALAAFEEEPLILLKTLSFRTDGVIFFAIAHNSKAAQAEGVLRSKGFVPSPYSKGTGESLKEELTAELALLSRALNENARAFFALSSQARLLKLYCDFLDNAHEKAESVSLMRSTEKAFFLEAFVPKGSEEEVRKALSGVSGAFWFTFCEPEEGEAVPTLLKNDKLVSNFEAITNMYSPPSHRELDPNPIMAIFYSIFIGFIMADIGYGLMMFFGGGFLYLKIKRGGMKNLAGVFAVGGILAVFWGVLFNSLCGISVLPFTVMPDAQRDMWAFMGINVPAVLMIALIIGVVQIFAGYVFRMVQCCRWGRFLDGLFDGGVWALFSLGVIVLIIGLIEEFELSFLTLPGAGIAVASLVVAMLTAGRREKLLGKFTKGFGALYGVINYVSDILSYARLYGLMLSGAVIAQIVSTYSVQFISSGSLVLAILGVLLMVIGHGFNLAISLLGAYIHDARLQYVEFYGRFYEGEGELFTPLGSRHKYVFVTKEAAVASGDKVAVKTVN